MKDSPQFFAAHVVALALAAANAAHAGGSNYGIAPGSLNSFAGKVSEWPVPTPRFARDPAPGPDGSIYITVMSGNKIARFDTRTHTFKEWELAPGHHPHGPAGRQAGDRLDDGQRQRHAGPA